jgi:hypothetical protein
MSKFFNDGIITSFPQSLDAAGQFPRIQVNIPNTPGDGYTQVMRADELSGILGDEIRKFNFVRYCIDVTTGPTPLGTTSMVDFGTAAIRALQDIVRENLNVALASQLENICSDLGIDTINFDICFFDIINADVKFLPHGGNDAYAYRTYDIVIYGQFTPNPAAEPAPAPCEPLTGYEFRTAYNVSDPTKGNLYTDPGDLTFIYLELFPKGGGTGVNFNTASVIGYTIPPSVAVGEYYAIRIEYDALISGTQIPIKVKPQNQDLGYIYLNDTGGTIYVLAQRIAGAGDPNIRIETYAQTPSAGENQPLISFQLVTSTCASL